MFLQDYNKSKLKYCDFQFAIAIALDRLHELAAAKSVLTFPALSADKAMKERERLEKELGKGNVLLNILNYYFNNKVFKKNNNSRTRSGSVLVSLDELLMVTSKDTIYQEVMQLLSRYARNDLITLYTQTQMFKREFANFVRRENHSSGHDYLTGQIDDSVIELLNYKFTDFVRRNCANGSYHTNSCSPNKFLFKRKEANGGNSGPVAWFQKENDGEYYNILNRRGNNATVKSTDGLSAIDLVSIKPHAVEHSINFIGLATKIYKASILLFGHGDRDTAYYDIFSYHRDSMLKPTQEEFKKLHLLGCNIDFATGKSSIEDLNQTISNKFNCRSIICVILERILTHGIRTDQISDLYTEVLDAVAQKCSVSAGWKDAKSPFSYDKPVKYTSREPGSNGSKFYTLLYGYLALKELIDYISNVGEFYGVTINNFPVEIFRDKGYLKRFKSFEDYIEYLADVKPLYERSCYTRNNISKDDIFYNDYVYDFLGSEQLLKNDVNLQLLSNAPIAFVGNVVQKYNSSNKDEKLLKEIKRITNVWSNSISVFNSGVIKCLKLPNIPLSSMLNVNKFLGNSGESLNKLSSLLAKLIISFSKEQLHNLRRNLYVYFFVCVYSVVLRAAAEKDGNPVCDESGHFLLTGSLFESLEMPDYYKEKMGEQNFNKFLLERARALKVSMWILWSTGIDSFANFNTDSEWVTLWSYWCTVSKTTEYLLRNCSVMNSLQAADGDICQMTIRATNYLDFLSMPNKIDKFSQLNSLNTSNTIFTVDRHNSNYNENLELCRKLQCKAVNILFNNLTEQFKVYSALAQRTKLAFGSLKYSYQTVLSDTDRILADAISVLEAHVLVGENDKTMVQKLEAITDFDNLGYAKSAYSRYSVDGKVFIHKTGYTVTVDIVNKQPVIKPITEDDLNNLRVRSVIE